MLELSPTLFLPILCVTPRPDRGVQGHMARPEQVALDSAIKSRNDKCKEGAPPPSRSSSGQAGGIRVVAVKAVARPYPSNASQGGTGLKVVTRWSIIRRTLAESALPGG